MSFFKSLLATGLTRVVIDVIKTDSKITVVLTPKSQAKNVDGTEIKPLRITYPTVEEMDEKFFLMTTAPLVKTREFFSNLEDYEKSIEDAQKAIAEKKEKVSAKGKAAAGKKASEKEEEKPKDDLFSIPDNISAEDSDKIIAEGEAVVANAKTEVTPVVDEVATETMEPVDVEVAEPVKDEAVVQVEPETEPEPEVRTPAIEEAEVEEVAKETPVVPIAKLPSLFS